MIESNSFEDVTCVITSDSRQWRWIRRRLKEFGSSSLSFFFFLRSWLKIQKFLLHSDWLSYLVRQCDDLRNSILAALDRVLSIEFYAWPSKTDARVKEFRMKRRQKILQDIGTKVQSTVHVEDAIRNVGRNEEIRTADSGLTNLIWRQREYRARRNEIAKYTFARCANSAEFLDGRGDNLCHQIAQCVVA